MTYFLSLFSPLSIFLVYYYNVCLAHNLFKTFFSNKNSYDKRIKVYKLLSILLSIIIFIFSIFFNRLNLRNLSEMAYYNIYFVSVFYILGLFSIVYIVYILCFVMTNNNNSNEANGKHNIYKDELIDKKKEILNLFIKKQITFLISFVLCYLPNNLIMILRIFFFIESSGMSFVTYLISISCLFSIIIKSTDPYTKKYIKFIYYLIFKASETVKLVILK